MGLLEFSDPKTSPSYTFLTDSSHYSETLVSGNSLEKKKVSVTGDDL